MHLSINKIYCCCYYHFSFFCWACSDSDSVSHSSTRGSFFPGRCSILWLEWENIFENESNKRENDAAKMGAGRRKKCKNGHKHEDWNKNFVPILQNYFDFLLLQLLFIGVLGGFLIFLDTNKIVYTWLNF